MSHLLGHGTSVYNGHLRGPMTLKPITECLTEELSLPVFTPLVSCGWDSKTQPSACGTYALAAGVTAAVGNYNVCK